MFCLFSFGQSSILKDYIASIIVAVNYEIYLFLSSRIKRCWLI